MRLPLLSTAATAAIREITQACFALPQSTSVCTIQAFLGFYSYVYHPLIVEIVFDFFMK